MKPRRFVIHVPGKPDIPAEKWRNVTAHHEAAHSLIGSALGLKLKKTFVPTEEHASKGHAGHTDFIHQRGSVYGVAAEIVATMAGRMGQAPFPWLVFGYPELAEGAVKTDDAHLRWLCSLLDGADEITLQTTFGCVVAFLARVLWPDIEYLAEYLLRHGTSKGGPTVDYMKGRISADDIKMYREGLKGLIVRLKLKD